MKHLTIVVVLVVLIAVAKAAVAKEMFEGRGRKIEFDDSVGMASHNVVYEDTEEEDEEEDEDKLADVTMANLEDLRWTGVTREGYEFEGTLAEVEEMLSDFESDYDGDDLDEEESDKEGEGDTNTDDNVPFGHTFRNISHSDRKANTEAVTCIYGSDSRKKTNVKLYPFNTVGRIVSGCTGAFISQRHVLTAGHCVYNRGSKKWYSNLDVLRGKSCNPHKGLQRHKWVRALSVTGYTKKGQKYSDYGMIIVKQKSPRSMYYGYRTFLLGWTINTAGYPYDKSPRGCMWHQSCKVRVGTTSKVLRFRCDIASGQSGSPIWVYRKNKRIVYGVVTHCSKPSNRGVRINKSRFKRIKNWIKKY